MAWEETARDGAVQPAAIARPDTDATVKPVAESAGSAEGAVVKRVAFALDGPDVSDDLSDLAAAASEGEGIVLTDEQAARVLSLARARADRSEAGARGGVPGQRLLGHRPGLVRTT